MAFSMPAAGAPFLAHAAPVSAYDLLPPPYKRMRIMEGMGSGGLAAYGKLLGRPTMAAAIGAGYGVPVFIPEANGPRCGGGEGRVATLVAESIAPSPATAAAFRTAAPAAQLPVRTGGAGAGEMMVEGARPHTGGGSQRALAMHHQSLDWPELPEPQMQRPAPLEPGAAISGSQRSAGGGQCTAIVPFFDLPGAIFRPGRAAALGDQGFEWAAHGSESSPVCGQAAATVEEIVLEFAGEECAADSMDCS